MMMVGKNKKYFILFLLMTFFLSTGNILAKENEELKLDKIFYLRLLRVKPIFRDRFLSKSLNRIVEAEGTVSIIDEVYRYRKSYRVVLIDNVALKYNLMIKYYLFINNEDYMKMIIKGEKFRFKGQLISRTPTNGERTSYIFDVIFETGVVVIE